MLNKIAETRITIQLDKEYVLYFNANTMCAFEEATGKNFLGTVASLYQAYQPLLAKQKAAKDAAAASGQDPAEVELALNTNSALDLIRHVPIGELSALIWAGLHTYDQQDNPHWPLSLPQVRRLITLETIPKLFLGFLKGQSANSPTQSEMGESPAPSGAVKVNGLATPQRSGADGGELFTELPGDAFT